MKIFGSITELVAAVFRKNGQAITLRPNQTTTYTGNRDIQSPPQDANSVLVSEDATQTLLNKTLTSPVVNTPTGITKADVGLGNVDNTSDATKNAATATLTNKTLTAPVINSPTGLVKADVGLGNVDNTSDATKNAAAVSLTNKTLVEPVIDNFMEMNEETTPAAPAAGKVRVYPKNDHKLYVLDENSVETPIGSGSGQGEINYISNPSALSAITGWVASGAGITVARTTTAADLPRASLGAAGIEITPVSGSTDYVYTRFTLGDADKAKLLKIQFALKALSGYAAGDLVVEMWTNAASNYGGAYTQLVVAQEDIPAGDLVFQTVFASSTADYYEMRIRRVAGTDAIVLQDVVVGPGSISSVPAVASMIPFVGSGSLVTNTAYEASYTRIGRTALINYKLTFAGSTGAGQITLDPPPGLTYDTSADGFDWSQTDRQILGTGAVGNATNITPIYALWNGTTVKLSFKGTFSGTGLTADVEDGNPFAFASGDTLTVIYQVPIAEWSDNVFSAESAVEYAFNTDLSDANDTTSFDYGIGGAQFGNFTAARTKRVRFRTPILPTDRIILQVSYDTGVTWTDVAGSGNIDVSTSQNATTYGAGVIAINSTDVDVSFGTYRRADGATFGAAGSGWGDIANLPGNVWRVVKSSNPLAIGHDLVGQNKAGLVASAGQLQGTNTDDHADAGNVGEAISSYIPIGSAVNVTNATGTSITSITLTPGDWDIDVLGQAAGSQGPGSSSLAIGINQTPGATVSVGDDTIQLPLLTGTYTTGGSFKRRVQVDTGTHTYHLNMLQDTGTTWTGWGRITARRVR